MGKGQPLVGTRFTRGLAIAGIVIGIAGIIGLGLLAWWNYDGWKKGRDKYPFISWYVAWLAIVGVLHFTITLIVVGPHRVWNYGGIGTAVMVVGAFLATDATWYYDQVRAEFPTLKTRKAA